MEGKKQWDATLLSLSVDDFNTTWRKPRELKDWNFDFHNLAV
jgi:hypothetical protein